MSSLNGKSNTRVPQKLALSSYTRKFPEGTCEYTFGTIKNIDLSSYASEVSNSLNM